MKWNIQETRSVHYYISQNDIALCSIRKITSGNWIDVMHHGENFIQKILRKRNRDVYKNNMYLENIEQSDKFSPIFFSLVLM